MLTSFLWIYITPIIMISPILTISMNSWFSMWMTLELNLMTFIPLIIMINKFYKETSIKYFIIQSLSSAMLIFSSNFNFIIINNTLNFSFLNFLNLMLNTALLIKLGTPPFHIWFINLMNNLNWMSCFILSLYQKIPPLILLFYIYNKTLIYLIILMSSIYSALFGNNHQSLRLIMAYSSINHLSWLLLNMMINQKLWIMYYINYFIINLTIMSILNKFNTYNINEIINLNKFKLNKFFLLFNFFSLSGLPPLMGFMMKWYSIYMTNKNMMFTLILIMTLMSMLTFLFYTRIMISFMMNFNLSTKFMLINKFYYKKSIKLNNSFIYLTFLNLWILNTWLL